MVTPVLDYETSQMFNKSNASFAKPEKPKAQAYKTGINIMISINSNIH